MGTTTSEPTARVLCAMEQDVAYTREDLVWRSDLPRTSVYEALKRLESSGAVVRLPDPAPRGGGRGRPQVRWLRIAPDVKFL